MPSFGWRRRIDRSAEIRAAREREKAKHQASWDRMKASVVAKYSALA